MKKNIECIVESEECTGCRMCEQSCPQSSISFQYDREGFLSPVIDERTCNYCGLCLKHCPQNSPVKLNLGNVYAVRLKNDKVLRKSASGGAFAALANYMLEQNGVVFGCAYDQNLMAVHICITSKDQLKRLQGSKYVQSNTGDTFSQVKEYLAHGYSVLYSGTGCQIAGLKAFLNKDYINLITVDVLCHGVPSPLLFSNYIKWLENKKGRLQFFDFRDKEKYGWSETAKIISNNNTNYIKASVDPYYNAFLKGLTLRECCYKCKYARKERVSDITIGDYWGIEYVHPDFFDIRGVSLLMANTPSGAAYFKETTSEFDYIESTIEKAMAQNFHLKHPTTKPKARDYIYAGFNNGDFNRYLKSKLKIRIKQKIFAIIPNNLKKLIKQMIRYAYNNK